MKSNGSQWFHNIWHGIRNNTHKNKTSQNINANVHNNNQNNKNHNYGSDNYTNSNYKQYFSGSRYVTDFIMTFCVIHTVTQLGIGYSICVGPSMLPTLDKDGQIVLIDKFSYKVLCADYKVGDVVVSRAKEDPLKSVCKRIKATSGDVVIDRANGTIMVIPEGHVWLAGDNVYNSSDSRMYGPMPIGMLQGRVFFKLGLYPFHASSIDHIVLKDKYHGMKYEQQDPNKQCYYVSKDRNITVHNDHDNIGNHSQKQQQQQNNFVPNSMRNKVNNTAPVGSQGTHVSYHTSSTNNDCNRNNDNIKSDDSSDLSNGTSDRHISPNVVEKILKP